MQTALVLTLCFSCPCTDPSWRGGLWVWDWREEQGHRSEECDQGLICRGMSLGNRILVLHISLTYTKQFQWQSKPQIHANGWLESHSLPHLGFSLVSVVFFLIRHFHPTLIHICELAAFLNNCYHKFHCLIISHDSHTLFWFTEVVILSNTELLINDVKCNC